MKVALITTTINVPRVLELYRAADPDVLFVIAGDRKSPDQEIADFLYDIPNHFYLGIDRQHEMYPRLSRLIGENTISRRNIALLEALRWGAELIVSVDDDNAPMGLDYFDRLKTLFNKPWSGLAIPEAQKLWYDPGDLYDPQIRHRGYPAGQHSLDIFTHVVDAQIRVAMGLVIGNADVSAIERMARGYGPSHVVSEMARSGIVVKTDTRTVFNTQNVAFSRTIAPCFLMVPQWNRMDDIWASLITQRVLRDVGGVVHLGEPFVFQERNPHDLVKDLKAEMLGYERTVEFAEWLNEINLTHTDDVAVKVLSIYQLMETLDWMPQSVIELGEAWVEDVEKVM